MEGIVISLKWYKISLDSREHPFLENRLDPIRLYSPIAKKQQQQQEEVA